MALTRFNHGVVAGSGGMLAPQHRSGYCLNMCALFVSSMEDCCGFPPLRTHEKTNNN